MMQGGLSISSASPNDLVLDTALFPLLSAALESGVSFPAFQCLYAYKSVLVKMCLQMREVLNGSIARAFSSTTVIHL